MAVSDLLFHLGNFKLHGGFDGTGGQGYVTLPYDAFVFFPLLAFEDPDGSLRSAMRCNDS